MFIILNKRAVTFLHLFNKMGLPYNKEDSKRGRSFPSSANLSYRRLAKLHYNKVHSSSERETPMG